MSKTKSRVIIVLIAMCLALFGCGFATISSVNAESGAVLTMRTGADLRADDDCTGLRFVAKMGKTAYEAIKDDVTEAGMLIMPEDYVGKYGELNAENAFGENAVYNWAIDGEYTAEAGKTRIINCKYDGMVSSGNEYVIRGTIADIKEANYARNFTARAYIKTSDGKVTFAEYADGSSANTTRNAKSIAKVALSSDTTNFDAKQLVALFEYTGFNGKIEGERYLPFFEPYEFGGVKNEMTWDETEGAYKFEVKTSNGGDERGFTINSDLFKKILTKTGVTKVSFQIKALGKSDVQVFTGYMPNWWGEHEMTVAKWWGYTEFTIDLTKKPTDDNGDLKTYFILPAVDPGSTGGIYIKDFTVERTSGETVSYDANEFVETAPVMTGLNVFNEWGWFNPNRYYKNNDGGECPEGFDGWCIISTDDGTNRLQYRAARLGFPSPIENAAKLTLRLYLADSGNSSITVRLYNHEFDKHAGNDATANDYEQIELPTNAWYYWTVDTAKFLNSEGKLAGFQFAIFGATTANSKIFIDGASVIKTVPEKNYLAENGLTEYSVLVEEGASETITTAANELAAFFKKATGATLAITNSAVAGRKYISLGNTDRLSENGITVDVTELKTSGYKIVTAADGSVIVAGATDKGTLYGVYELLSRLFGYETYYVDTYSMNTGVYTLELPSLSITEVPAIDYRAAGYGAIIGDETTLNRMRLSKYEDKFMHVGGEIFHNSMLYVQGGANEDDKWYNSERNQLCYTAHGDDTAYNDMVAAAAETLKAALIANPNKTAATFSVMDNYDNCNCVYCLLAKGKNQNDTDLMLKFVNALRAKIDEWFEGEGSAYKRDFDLVAFAYQSTVTAPKSVVPADGVKVLYAPVQFDFAREMTDSVNSDSYDNANAWIGKTNGAYLWYYTTNFYYYLAPFMSVDAMQSYYAYAKNVGAEYIFEQGQWNNSFATGFSNLKAYLASKLAWNTSADVAALTDKFFDGYFGVASDVMKTFYNELNAQYAANTGLQTAVSCQADPLKTEYWSYEQLARWIGYCDTALAGIEDLKISDPESYSLYRKHIAGERISPIYLMIELYSGILSEETRNAYIETFKSDVFESGISLVRESDCDRGDSAFSALYERWSTAGITGVTTDLVAPSATLDFGGKEFLQIETDGTVLSASDYAVAADGASLSLTSAYIASAGQGTHIYTVSYKDGTSAEWRVTVTDEAAPEYELKGAFTIVVGETLPVAVNKAGTYQQNITPVYYLNGEQVEAGAAATETGSYTFTVKFMRNGEIISGSEITTTILIASRIKENVYNASDFTQSAPVMSGLMTFNEWGWWTPARYFVVDGCVRSDSYDGYGLQYRAARLGFASAIENVMTFALKLRISDAERATVTVRLYNYDFNKHAGNDATANDYEEIELPANVWYDWNVDIAKFLNAEGKLEGFQFAIFGATTTGSYDGANSGSSVSIMSATAGVAAFDTRTDYDANELKHEAIVLNGVNPFEEYRWNTFEGYYTNNDGLPEGSSGYAIISYGSNNAYSGTYLQYRGARLGFTSDYAAENVSTIIVRVYFKDSEKTSVNIRLYNYTETQVEGQYEQVSVPTNQWYDITVSANKFATDGKVSGFQLFVFESGSSSDSMIFIDGASVWAQE